MEPGKMSGNIAFTLICNMELQESQDEEIINLGETQEYEVNQHFQRMPLVKYTILLRLRI